MCKKSECFRKNILAFLLLYFVLLPELRQTAAFYSIQLLLSMLIAPKLLLLSDNMRSLEKAKLDQKVKILMFFC
ncbi:hypothetical protein A9R01_13390 ['Osedax' symbiont bacterium Rs2_46_30_T18]|nr:hypothetical protein A9R01_13390 ['Osedax' symbiont bacterium Rs2_46_30_T18]